MTRYFSYPGDFSSSLSKGPQENHPPRDSEETPSLY
ncbi:hypothetical protein COLO4_26555 [Corchorus olitorius]|uniref:Uncharacterized protein n=1 Tax=Corchorus olitorius TaxID=93759 RepID=A0A1R3HWC1_9ROSI|nr:hypothetical protein COLO4_26555 [Corchorus olitorius]